jgi:peptide methionine sulfoxide reductase MsrB
MNELTPEEKRVIIDKGTEAPFVGEYTNNKETGVYVCKQCNAPLYDSKDKFESTCGCQVLMMKFQVLLPRH